MVDSVDRSTFQKQLVDSTSDPLQVELDELGDFHDGPGEAEDELAGVIEGDGGVRLMRREDAEVLDESPHLLHSPIPALRERGMVPLRVLNSIVDLERFQTTQGTKRTKRTKIF
jgi:hypothetical protein